MAPCKTVICVTGSPEAFRSVRLEFLNNFIGDGHVTVPHVEHHIVVAVFSYALEP
jgi:hypothetical protein